MANRDFRNGKLYDYHPRLKNLHIIRAWPNPQAWRISHDGRKLAHNPISLRVRPTRAGRSPYSRFLQTIPLEVRQLIAPFPENHWKLLKLAARCPNGERLLQNVPTLGYAIACHDEFTYCPRDEVLRKMRWLAKQHYRKAGMYLGFHDPKPMLNQMLKIPRESCCVATLRMFRVIFLRKTKILFHLPRLNLGVLTLLCAHHEHVASDLAYEVALNLLEDKFADAARDLANVLEAARWLGIETKQKFVSSRQIQNVGNELILRLEAKKCRTPLPAPPIPGTATIIPLHNSKQVLLEATEQRNCLTNYLRSMNKGYCYAYKVLQPERATLLITKVEDRWIAEELRLFANAKPSPYTVSAVHDWLENARSTKSVSIDARSSPSED